MLNAFNEKKNQIILHGKEELPFNTTQLINEVTLQCFQSIVIDVRIKLIDWIIWGLLKAISHSRRQLMNVGYHRVEGSNWHKAYWWHAGSNTYALKSLRRSSVLLWIKTQYIFALGILDSCSFRAFCTENQNVVHSLYFIVVLLMMKSVLLIFWWCHTVFWPIYQVHVMILGLNLYLNHNCDKCIF